MKSVGLVALGAALAAVAFWFYRDPGQVRDPRQVEAKCAMYVDHELANVPRATDAEYASWQYRADAYMATCKRAGCPP
jgi:hypothetical protein